MLSKECTARASLITDAAAALPKCMPAGTMPRSSVAYVFQISFKTSSKTSSRHSTSYTQKPSEWLAAVSPVTARLLHLSAMPVRSHSLFCRGPIRLSLLQPHPPSWHQVPLGPQQSTDELVCSPTGPSQGLVMLLRSILQLRVTKNQDIPCGALLLFFLLAIFLLHIPYITATVARPSRLFVRCSRRKSSRA